MTIVAMAASFILTPTSYSCGWCTKQGKWSGLQLRAALSREEEEFEARLARLQRKVGSGSGKKAELRKARKEASSSRSAVLLPPVPLEDPVSDGLVVELGFNPYTERLNGRFASLGLAAILLVELATGESLVKYHDAAVIAIQVYSVLAAAALFVKYEKEKRSVWPLSTISTTAERGESG